jgi:signal transduction histidine kinase
MIKRKQKRTKISDPGSVLAHQLKNPISVLNGYLEVLLSEEIGEINKKQKEYLSDAIENVKTMSRTVNDLLDVSKIEEGYYKLNPKNIDLAEVVQGVIDELSPWIKASNVNINFEKPKDIKVFADPLKIRYVVENLISNSVRYKGPGVSFVRIELNKKNEKVIFSCEDNGIGIPKKDFDKVFSKYYRSEEALNFYPSGTGLGLYISRAIVELSDGKIWFEKNKNKGITFYFTLPSA